MRSNSSAISKTEIVALSLEQLQELSVLVANRMQIKRRFNNTPLRRIIARQVTRSAVQAPPRSDSDTASQTDTLVNNDTPETNREPLQVRKARYNNTPLRRILSCQASPGRWDAERPHDPMRACNEPESLEVRKARFNDTPLRRIVSRQTCSNTVKTPEAIGARPTPPPSVPRSQSSTPVPRSNTPLRRILSRQVSTRIIPPKEDQLSERADSVIDPGSPVRSRSTASVPTVLDGAWMRSFETRSGNLSSNSPSSAPVAA
ncbi:uncharacterized protein M421DRAFT_6521 [Didymella exigua CBS 183.55]|uniref:Uncharacterized protein n=1 Tax=Didymella exigua CBS 183.55 TaxID=1150837 RepID=A0A6A5RHE0_9PLEO|nr:uncharacterized protein M421DRAFT_6521 [Didymella exigua CBS 183.55]KAF1926959.1 hypothetical protein M421DRAFT_6521 [Didymella exigua CBS 183.55]